MYRQPIIVTYIPYDGPHGLANRVKGICTVLQQRGKRSIVICPGEDDVVSRKEEATIRHISLPIFKENDVYAGTLRVLAILFFQIKAFAVILAYSLQFRIRIQIEQILQLPLIALLRAFLRTQVIVDDLNLLHLDYRFLPDPLLKLMDWLCVQMCDTIATASIPTIRYLKARQGNKRIIFASNGVSCSKTRLSCEKGVQEHVRFVFIGSLGFVQNLTALRSIMDFARALDNNQRTFHVDIVGGPLSAARLLMQDDMVKKGLVKMHGFLSEEELHSVLESAVVGLLPFFEDTPLVGGQRTKALQYMASGLLVLSGPEGIGRMKHVKPGVHYIECSTRKQFLHLLDKITTNAQEYHQIAENGRQVVEEEYSWNRTLTELIRVLVGQFPHNKDTIGGYDFV